MESSWVIYGADGTGKKLTVRKLKYSGTYMGDCTVSMSVSSAVPIDWATGDYLTFRGETFVLSTLPKVKKQAIGLSCGEAFVYDSVTFVAVGNYELGNCAFLDVVYDDNNLHYTSLPKFSVYFANAGEFAKRLQANLNRIYTNGDGSPKWSVAVADGTEIKAQSLSFEGVSCLEALKKCNTDLNLNYVLRGRKVTIGTKDALVAWDFEYGKHKSKSEDRGGLVDWEKTVKDNQTIITRLRAYGNTTNLPWRYYNYLWWREIAGERQYKYYKLDSEKYDDATTLEVEIDGEKWTRLINPAMYVPNLMLPSFRDGSQTYITNPGETPEHKVIDAYVDSEAKSALGILEGVKFFDGSGTDTVDVYPTLKGMTTENVAAGMTSSEREENNMALGSDGKPEYDQGALDEIFAVTDVDGFDGLIPEGEMAVKTFCVYVKNLGFDINDYVGTDGAKIAITEGACAGREFEIVSVTLVTGTGDKIDKTHKSEAWYYRLECKVTADTSIERYFPYKQYPISIGDKFVLTGVNMPDVYVRAAEQRLLVEAKKYLAANDHTVFTYKPSIDSIAMRRYEEIALSLKEGCTLHIVNYDEALPIDESITISQLEITCGESALPEYDVTLSDEIEAGLAQRVTQEVSEKLSNVMLGGTTVVGGGASPYIITTLDPTAPTDRNVMSAARAVKQFADKEKALTEFLRKDIDDTANGRINFESGLESEDILVRTLATIAKAIVGQTGSKNFRDGFMGEGWRIWQNASGESCATLDRLTVRKTWAVLELLIGKVRSVGGQICVSAANGKIKAVAESATNYIITFEAENTFAAHDLMRCQTFSTVEVDGGETAATPRGYWVEVSGVQSNDSVLVPKSEFLGQDTPQPGDECVLMGNTQNADRQNLVLISATEDGQPRVDVMNGVQSKDTAFTGCLRARLGNLDGIVDSYFPDDAQPQGDGLYADNAYLRGTFVLSNGNDVKQLFELMDNKLRSVISDNWATNNLLVNGWLFNGLAGWTDDNGAAAVAGGKALAMGEGVLTCAGLPIVQGKTAPQWELKTEDGITYISENDGWEDYTIGTGWVTQPTTPSRLTLRIKVRDLWNGATGDTQGIGYRLLGADADGMPIDEELRSATSGDGDWAEDVITTESTFARFDGLFINTQNPVDIAEVSVVEMRMSSTEIEQTANRIALTVTESNNGKMKKAGIDIDAETITLSAAHTRIVDDEGKTVALFERGKIKTAFLDLGSLNITADDIPMLRELTSAVDREAITGATAEQNITGTAEVTVSAVMSHKAFAVTTADRYIYFTAKAAVTSALGVMGETVEVAYSRHISDELVQEYQGYAESVGGGNWRIKCDKTITDLKLTYKVAVQVTSVGEAERGGTVKLTMGGYQGSGEVALVPTADEGSLLTETVVGANGFASIWESKFVFHLQSTDKTYTDSKGTTFAQPAGCTMMAGDYGWRITAAGIEKTNDRGLNWSKA